MAPFFLAIAEVGLSPIQKASIELVQAVAKFNVPLRSFDSLEEAKDWVASVHTEQTRKKT